MEDIHSGRRRDRLFAEMYPGSTPVPFNLATPPTPSRSGGKRARRNVPAVTLGPPSAESLPTSSGCGSTTRCFRRTISVIAQSPSWRFRHSPARCGRPFTIGDDAFLKVGVHSLSVIHSASASSLRRGFRWTRDSPRRRALLPKVERTSRGGSTVRGYQLDHVRMEVEQLPLVPAPQGASASASSSTPPLGGDLRILQNVNLQFPFSPPVRFGLHGRRGGRRLLLRLGLSRFRRGIGISPCSSAFRSVTLAWPRAGPLNPGPAAPGSASFLVTSA